MNLSDQVTKKITSSIPDAKVEVIDFSSEHIGHHASGAHIAMTVVSKEFKNKTLVEQHQMIYKILEYELKEQIIHALRIRTKVE